MMLLTVVAACEYGFLQFFLLQEKRLADNMKTLSSYKGIGAKVLQHCKEKKVNLLAVLYEAENAHCPKSRRVSMIGPKKGSAQVADSSIPPKFGLTAEMRKGGEAIRRSLDLKEIDLGFIRYTWQIFVDFDKDGSDDASILEVRRALKFFNVYLSHRQTQEIVEQFLLDEGEGLPEGEVTLTYTLFTALLFKIEDYSLGATFEKSYVHLFYTLPRSKQCDVVSQIAFPVLVLACLLFFYVLLPFY
eukprot:gb/GFBE01051752.1/.p1 GENE.gb/GFBE01051752.1/~~gb/GFBE01051752.1/.p1  ORF type:complete len:245 (+),score=63.64 gb/GFBE01051752.1/:1-735(+)